MINLSYKITIGLVSDITYFDFSTFLLLFHELWSLNRGVSTPFLLGELGWKRNLLTELEKHDEFDSTIAVNANVKVRYHDHRKDVILPLMICCLILNWFVIVSLLFFLKIEFRFKLWHVLLTHLTFCRKFIKHDWSLVIVTGT